FFAEEIPPTLFVRPGVGLHGEARAKVCARERIDKFADKRERKMLSELSGFSRKLVAIDTIRRLLIERHSWKNDKVVAVWKVDYM
ncbi:hypothetical protein TSAR_006760, partial [Trichomalopsis sarcophagae]